MDKALCKNEIPEKPYAQKYPLKQKCTPAIMQSQIYARRYCVPSKITSASLVKIPTTELPQNWTISETTSPNPTAILTA